jgi:PAS domain S-box-containing protein
MKKKGIPPESDREWVILRGAIENTNDGFVTIDGNHEVIIFNKAAEKIFGVNREEVLGRDLGLILTAACNQGHKEAVARYLATRKPKLIGHQSEFRTTRPNGEVFPLSISFSVSEVSGKLYFTGLIRDLTETKALQDQVTQSERLAAVGQLVAEITHEIKTPLVMIGGFARQLIRSIPDEKSQSKLKVIAEEVQRLEKLILELREVYRPKSLILEPLNLMQLLEEIYFLSKEDCEKGNIQIRLMKMKRPVRIEGDPEKLKQVFLNLVRNAIEAMEKGGSLIIKPKVIKDKVEISVEDTGPGISPKDQEKLFTPFYTTKSKGTGLGLCVSRRIIEDHPGSTLRLDSVEGKGTVVKITLPLYKEEKENLRKPPGPGREKISKDEG